jgi:hypothetical protein
MLWTISKLKIKLVITFIRSKILVDLMSSAVQICR